MNQMCTLIDPKLSNVDDSGVCHHHVKTANLSRCSAIRSGDVKRPKLCVKEGCTVTVSVNNPNTMWCCSKHANECTKVNRRLESRKGSCLKRKCLKDGCATPLAGNQTKRCLEHKGQCKKKGCTKLSRSCEEFCQRHGREAKCFIAKTNKPHQKTCPNTGDNDSNISRFCIKESCHNKLKPHQPKRCSEHIMKCIHKGCSRYFDDNQGGYCFLHSQNKGSQLN
jgi:hypothetical protein